MSGQKNDKRQEVLLTGGAGFIGSHCAIELHEHGYKPIIVDNFFNSTVECLRRVEKIIGEELVYYKCDINDYKGLDEIFKKHKIFAVVHFAGFKSVGISVTKPLEYYANNIGGTVTLLTAMRDNGVFNFLFSGSSTVYGNAKVLPLTEDYPCAAMNIASPYGRTKYVVEYLLRDLVRSDKRWNTLVLRYFNPVGAHRSGLIGEDPLSPEPPNLMPYISRVAIGRLPFVKILGQDYDTPDGTGVRSYTHISDIANGHTLAVKKLLDNPGFRIFNLGSGIKQSVMEMLHFMEKSAGKSIPYQIFPRREGDVPIMDSDSTRARTELGWKPSRNAQDMCDDLWRFQILNPLGYSVPYETLPPFEREK